MKKQFYLATLSTLLCLGAWGCSDDSSSNSKEASEGNSSSSGSILGSNLAKLETTIKEDGPDMFNYGQLNGVVTADSLLSIFEYGDIVTVVVAEKDTFVAPVVSAWNDVSSGEYLVMAVENTPYITMGENYGQTGVDFGIAKSSEGKAETLYILRDDISLPVKVEITMKEKGGYIENLKMREKQNQGKKRENYPKLSDPEYANFRAISTPGMGKNVMYRSSSPIDPSLGRSTFADSLASESKIAVFINLTDNEKGLSAYENFDKSYYSKQHIAALGLPAAFTSTLFKDGLVKGFRYMIENEGPYLVHCREGKDRAGYVSAILEALMGASVKDIKDDYTKTYTNYYNVVNGVQDPLTEDDVAWFAKIIVLNMKLGFAAEGIRNPDLEDSDLQYSTEVLASPLFGIKTSDKDSIPSDEDSDEAEWVKEMISAEKLFSGKTEDLEEITDLQKATEKYLQSLGLTAEEIEALKNRLK